MATKQAAAKKKSGDTTRTARANAHLERLDEAKGKRIVVDFYADERQALDSLVATGYADTQSAVLRKAVIEIATRRRKKA